MKTIKEILIDRDGMDPDAAQDLIDEVKEEIRLMVENGSGLCEIEDVVMVEFGLEPDYLDELLPI